MKYKNQLQMHHQFLKMFMTLQLENLQICIEIAKFIIKSREKYLIENFITFLFLKYDEDNKKQYFH